MAEEMHEWDAEKGIYFQVRERAKDTERQFYLDEIQPFLTLIEHTCDRKREGCATCGYKPGREMACRGMWKPGWRGIFFIDSHGWHFIDDDWNAADDFIQDEARKAREALKITRPHAEQVEHRLNELANQVRQLQPLVGNLITSLMWFDENENAGLLDQDTIEAYEGHKKRLAEIVDWLPKQGETDCT